MAKKTWVIISLIISIIALMYMFLVHYGIMRYFNMHTSSMEPYIKNYHNLPKSDKKNRVVISFVADEGQLNKLKPFINSILNQSVRVDDIALTIPYKLVNKVPKDLKKIVSVYGINKDYDDANKLVPVLLREPEAGTKIIIVEPNMVYGKDFVADMVDASNNDSNSVIYGKKGLTRYGMLVKPEFFDEKVSKYQAGSGCCGWAGKCANADFFEIGCPETYKSWA